MKSKVHFSIFCIVMTAATFGILLTAIVATRHEADECIMLSAITLFSALLGTYYCPVSVSIESDSVCLHRLLGKNRNFKFSDIESVDTCYPSAGGIRLCGSGGFFGYWGYFSDIIIGQYFGYYADRSQCFCIKLKNKKQYVLSCKNHFEMVNAIQKNLK